jgi:hypothetical protein
MAGPRNHRGRSGNVSMSGTAGSKSNATLQDPREPAARCDQASAQYADLKTGGGVEMPFRKKGRYAPPVHLIKLTQERETPYVWVHLMKKGSRRLAPANPPMANVQQS